MAEINFSFLKINKTDKRSVQFLKLSLYCVLVTAVVVRMFTPILPQPRTRVEYIRGCVHADADVCVRGATVEIVGSQYRTCTDNFGEFYINRLEGFDADTPLQLKIIKPGYDEFNRTIKISEPHVFIDSYLHKN